MNESEEQYQWVNVVCGCVIKNENRYLLVQERKKSVHGLWNLPGGRVSLDEPLEKAAIREVYEESGYHVEIKSEINVQHHNSSSPVLHAFTAQITGGQLTVNTDELLDARWFTFKEVEDLQTQKKLRNDWVIESINQVENT